MKMSSKYRVAFLSILIFSILFLILFLSSCGQVSLYSGEEARDKKNNEYNKLKLEKEKELTKEHKKRKICYDKGKDYDITFDLFEDYNLTCDDIVQDNIYSFEKVSQSLRNWINLGVVPKNTYVKRISFHLDCNGSTIFWEKQGSCDYRTMKCMYEDIDTKKLYFYGSSDFNFLKNNRCKISEVLI